jgi:hypothetical protein
MKMDIHTAELLVTDPSPSEAEIALAKFKKYKSKQELECYCLKSISALILFGINKNCLISEQSLLLYN